MYCPNCGSTNSAEQAFCRGCGMNLESISDALLAQKPQNPADGLDAEERRLERFGKAAFTGFGFVLFTAIAAIIFLIITKMILSGTQPWAGALLAAFIFFAGLLLGYVFWQESLKGKRTELLKRGRANLADVAAADPARLNSSNLEPASSITEHTTRDLAGERRARQ